MAIPNTVSVHLSQASQTAIAWRSHPASPSPLFSAPSASPASAITSAGSRARMGANIRAAPEGAAFAALPLATSAERGVGGAREFLLRQAGLEPRRRHEFLASRSWPDVDDRDKPHMR